MPSSGMQITKRRRAVARSCGHHVGTIGAAVADTTSALAREQMRQWLENWRCVNETQDGLVKSEPSRNPAASLESGLSLIAFARELRQSNPPLAGGREGEMESVRRTWRRLRDAYAK